MCIAYISVGQPDWPLLIAANRDEFHDRPTKPLSQWLDMPNIIAGKDLQAGGTWMGWSRNGLFGFLTNYREPDYTPSASAPSRGGLAIDFLSSSLSPAKYAQKIIGSLDKWAGFNLVIGNLNETWYLTNRNFDNEISVHDYKNHFSKGNNIAVQLSAGNYIISNHLLNTPWPKSVRLQKNLQQIPAKLWLQESKTIFDCLHDTEKAAIADLPHTGINQQFEHLLSSPFIISEKYGTRCSSILAINDSGNGLFSELNYNNQGEQTTRSDWPISIEN